MRRFEEPAGCVWAFWGAFGGGCLFEFLFAGFCAGVPGFGYVLIMGTLPCTILFHAISQEAANNPDQFLPLGLPLILAFTYWAILGIVVSFAIRAIVEINR